MADNVPITGTIRATPQNPTLGKVASALRSLQEMAGKYQVLPQVPLLGGTSVDELLGLPGAAREVENWSYGNYPVRINPDAGRTASYIPEIKPGRKSDLADTLLLGMDVAPLAQLAGKGVSRSARALEDATVGALQRARIRNAAAQVPQDTAYDPLRQRMEASGNLMYAVKPEGNINLQPVLRSEALRGPDVQPIEAFMAQSKAMPGVTKDAFAELMSRYSDVAPGTKMSKADFEARIPPSQFNKVDLHSGTAGGIEDDLMEQAYDAVNEDTSGVFEIVFDRLGIPTREIPDGQYRNYIDSLHRYHSGEIGPEDLPAPVRKAMERDGLLEDRYAFDSLVQEQLDEAVFQTAQHMRQYWNEDPIGAGGYRFTDVQRLLPDKVRSKLDEEKYFELGVTHPDKADVSYRHYPNYESSEDGLIGHIRGTKIPADVKDATAYVPGMVPGKERAVIPLKPNSVIIEEIQSDAQKGAFSAEQTGALRQVHGTLFKAAIDDALEKGATTVYYPTAQTIALVRGGNPKPYASIYDQQIMREGLKPLGKIPGVEIKPIESMMFVKPNESPKPVVVYYEINFSPEAKEFILNGPGQTTPGYGGGGVVKGAVKSIGELVEKYAAKEAAVKEQKMLQGFYRGYAGDYDAARAAAQDSGVFVSPQRAVGEYYATKRAAQTGLDPHLEMILADPFAGRGYGHSTMGTGKKPPMVTRARELAPEDVKDRTKLYAGGGLVKYDPDEIAQIAERTTQGFAAGGLVDYDPNEIDTIVSKLKEEFHG